ncbi:methyltransferase [Aureococcus anophagefferens]|nr:methyltransferase [Aureococcus anophagefferens]
MRALGAVAALALALPPGAPMIVRIAETEYDVDEAVVFDDHRALPSLLADFRELNVDWPSLGFDGCASADCAAAGLLAELRRRRVTIADDARGLIVKIAAVGEILVPRDARGSRRKATWLVSGNHVIHNDAAEYWGMILKPVVAGPASGGEARPRRRLRGRRNVANLLRLAAWDRVDGCDLVARHVEGALAFVRRDGWDRSKFHAWQSAGAGLAATDGRAPAPVDEYDFVMSTIALQHICVYVVRRGILEDILAALRPGGLVSLQMVYRAPHEAPLDPARHAPYDANVFDANGTNSDHDVRVTDLDRVVEDLEDIGFVDVEYEVGGWHLGYVVSYPDQWLIAYARPGPRRSSACRKLERDTPN